MNKVQKEQCVSNIQRTLQGKSLVVVVKPNAVTVAESTQLRRDMRQESAGFKVVKNTLLRLAVKGTAFEGLLPFLTGTSAIAYSEDPISAAKVVCKFADDREGKMQIAGAWMNGDILSTASVQALAKLPSLDELRSNLLRLLLAPATKLVRTINEPMVRVARVIGAKV
ncbi:MAG: 50S ribosomal protein L10 [Holosporales bacterium]|jgi:large subunit ribosomal protein L10|nr:50S ribosomal protein L10 [Holosporales bacterium]